MFTKNPNSSIVHFILALIFLTGMLGAKPASLVHASSLTVTNINDGGAGSLRQTIADAVSGDTITFDPSLDGQTIIINATLSIDKNLTIDGSSLASKIIISGESNVRVFEIYPNNTVVMEYLAITGLVYGFKNKIKWFFAIN